MIINRERFINENTKEDAIEYLESIAFKNGSRLVYINEFTGTKKTLYFKKEGGSLDSIDMKMFKAELKRFSNISPLIKTSKVWIYKTYKMIKTIDFITKEETYERV